MATLKRQKYRWAVHLYEVRGLSIAALADKYGVTRQAMHGVLKRRGCKFRERIAAVRAGCAR